MDGDSGKPMDALAVPLATGRDAAVVVCAPAEPLTAPPAAITPEAVALQEFCRLVHPAFDAMPDSPLSGSSDMVALANQHFALGVVDFARNPRVAELRKAFDDMKAWLGSGPTHDLAIDGVVPDAVAMLECFFSDTITAPARRRLLPPAAGKDAAHLFDIARPLYGSDAGPRYFCGSFGECGEYIIRRMETRTGLSAGRIKGMFLRKWRGLFGDGRAHAAMAAAAWGCACIQLGGIALAEGWAIGYRRDRGDDAGLLTPLSPCAPADSDTRVEFPPATHRPGAADLLEKVLVADLGADGVELVLVADLVEVREAQAQRSKPGPKTGRDIAKERRAAECLTRLHDEHPKRRARHGDVMAALELLGFAGRAAARVWDGAAIPNWAKSGAPVGGTKFWDIEGLSRCLAPAVNLSPPVS